ncbi:hypothetical protein HPP92_018453 [Vanilla planifolia]|uniref:Uncharacterized protein n=1 Tax=Vanilla planifolia TaxID=51239 RepID=A0A835QEF2_VANPL|nr:hypothetical protein HPP92_018453 [Vanilla planifolia]
MVETLEAKEKVGHLAGPPSVFALPKGPMPLERPVVDTSVPFVSVKDVVDRFGGSVFVKSQLREPSLLQISTRSLMLPNDIELIKIHQQTAKLEMELTVKERQSIATIEELETAKRIINNLNLLKGNSKPNQVSHTSNSCIINMHLSQDAEEIRLNDFQKDAFLLPQRTIPKSSPGLMLVELQQAKMNLRRATCGISNIRVCVELLKNNIVEEQTLLEKAHQRLRLHTTKLSTLKENLTKSKMELQLIKDAQTKHEKNSAIFSSQIKDVSLEKKEFLKITEAAKVEAAKLGLDIVQTKAAIEAAEAISLAEKEAANNNLRACCGVTLSLKDYAQLICKVQGAEEKSKKAIETALAQLNVTRQSNLLLQTKLKKAIADAKASKKLLKVALKREDDANREKLAAEEALQRVFLLKKVSSTQNNTKFKKFTSTSDRTETRMLDMNGVSLITNGRLKSFSIGQILDMKLDFEGHEKGISGRRSGRGRVTLGQILSQKPKFMSPTKAVVNKSSTKFSSHRRKFGFIGLSLLLPNQKKNNKQQLFGWILRSNCRALVL